MSNPWIDYDDLPPFETAEPAELGAAVAAAIESNREGLACLETDLDAGALVERMDAWAERLHRAFSPLAHLHSVADSPALREVYEQALAAVIGYQSELAQDRGLFDALERAQASAAPGSPEARVIQLALRDFRLAGVDLPEDERREVRRLHERLGQAQSQFEKNVLDATEAFTLTVTDETEVAGLPPAALRAARRRAEEAGDQGWQFNLMLPCYLPVMMHARSRSLRQRLYEAYVTRASELGPGDTAHDNGALMVEILRLRRSLAGALHFEHFAAYSLASKMADSAGEVIDFLLDLAARTRPLAVRELEELQAFALDCDGLDELQAWDIPYYSEQLREARFSLSDEVLRQYFPLPRVLGGLFEITSRLYGVTITEAEAPRWHEAVRYYEIRDAGGELRAGFYLDLYARTGKRGGAWMDDCLIRRKLGGRVQCPVAYLTCNFTEPEHEDQPALLSHQDVTTLFHEFGHGLHHMLTRVDRGAISGINGVAWDAVELPSQLLENWCWHADSLGLISGHVETGAPLPEAMFRQLLASRRFQAGLQMLRQIEFALFDMRLHAELEPGEGTSAADVMTLLDAVREEVALVRYPQWNRFPHAFTHIFAGGYAAGYYSYKWAEVLAADAFSAFEREGVLNPDTGARFLDKLLARGGLREPLELFRDFLGREPRPDALLAQAGVR